MFGNLDFPAILLGLTILSGVIALVDIIYCRKKGIKDTSEKKPVIIEYARAFFPVLLVVFLLRSFIVQPYRVPTGSLKPTIMPGDFILVDQFSYGLRLPVWHKKIISIGEPKVGQIGLFRWPVNPKVTFIKRVIGVPGDTISYIDNVLYVNGKKAKQKFIGYAQDSDSPTGPHWKVAVYQEDLNGVKHKIYLCPKGSTQCPVVGTHNFYNLKVPKGKYFMMGDNRDNSDDSRDWGFVPEKNYIGKALFVWMSWNSGAPLLHKIRWDRIGNVFH